MSAWRKEWFLLWPRTALWLAAGLWLALALYFLAAYQEYKILAPQLAALENRRGATQMLLLPVNQLLLWMLAGWSLFFGARAVAQEYVWHTVSLYGRDFPRKIITKALVLWLSLLLLTLPFWLSAGWLSRATHWDGGLLLGVAAAQLLFSLYAVGLVMAVSATLRQGVLAALAAVVVWLLLWLAPLLMTSPPALADMLQWLSPFSHVALLTQGVFHVQTAIFTALHALFFVSLTVVAQQEVH